MADGRRPCIAVADPTLASGSTLLRMLEAEDYAVATADNAARLRRVIADGGVDLLLLDPRIPGGGLDLVKQLKRERPIPIIIVSAWAAPHERAAGLEAGADDYVAKPVYPAELMVRVAKLLAPRPVRDEAAAAAPAVAMWRGCFSPAERRLLELLVIQTGRIVSRETLAGGPAGSDDELSELRRVDVLVSRIRSKLKTMQHAPMIETCRGYGYRLRWPAAGACQPVSATAARRLGSAA